MQYCSVLNQIDSPLLASLGLSRLACRTGTAKPRGLYRPNIRPRDHSRTPLEGCLTTAGALDVVLPKAASASGTLQQDVEQGPPLLQVPDNCLINRFSHLD